MKQIDFFLHFFEKTLFSGQGRSTTINPLTPNFLQSSIDKGFLGLNGHRSIGGVRVSNYNSISNDMMNDLITHLKGFI